MMSYSVENKLLYHFLPARYGNPMQCCPMQCDPLLHTLKIELVKKKKCKKKSGKWDLWPNQLVKSIRYVCGWYYLLYILNPHTSHPRFCMSEIRSYYFYFTITFWATVFEYKSCKIEVNCIETFLILSRNST